MHNFCSKNNFFHRGNLFIRILKIIGVTIAGIAAAAVIALLFGLLVELLWNWLMPEIFGLPTINYWQAFGLIILAKIFFGSGHGHNTDHKSSMKRFIKKNKDESEPEKAKYHHWHNYKKYWKEEGKDAFEKYMVKVETEEKADKADKDQGKEPEA